MFCVTCGTAILEEANFCHGCGRGFTKTDTNGSLVETGTSDMVEAKKEEKPVKIRSFEQYKFDKGHQWKKRVSGKSKKKENSPKEEEVVIFIGLITWHEKDCKLKPIRGKRITLKVSNYDKGITIKIKGENKWKEYYPNLYNSDFLYKLVYESGIEVTNLPGTSEPFVLHKYKEDVGKDYKRITLYLCPENDIFISKKTFFNSDSSSESEEPVKKVENDDQFEPIMGEHFSMDQILYNGAILTEPNIFEPVLNNIAGSIYCDNREIIPTIPSSTSSSRKNHKICLTCSCTYIDTCLICEHNLEYNASLLSDQQSGSTVYSASPVNFSDQHSASNFTTASPSAAYIRGVRLKHFKRKRNDNDSNDDKNFGDDEVDRFLEESHGDKSIDINQTQEISDNINEDPAEFLLNLSIRMAEIIKTKKSIIVQRDINRFWKILLKQSFDLSKQYLNVRFAGESGADAGGPHVEFLTLCMRNFHQAPDLFGSATSICFSGSPQYCMENMYFILGQLVGVSIITTGRGPECLHELIVKQLFNEKIPTEFPEYYFNDFEEYVKQISEGNFDILYDLNITPSNQLETDKRLFLISLVLLKSSYAIQQFRDGLASIDDKMVHPDSYSLMQQFLQSNNKSMQLEELLTLFNYKRECDPESNKWRAIDDTICEFELFLNEISSSAVLDRFDVVLKLRDVLFFLSGYDTIPPHGMPKKIDVYFTEEQRLPEVSTCGLTVTIPLTSPDFEVATAIKTAMSFGCGFGTI